MLALSRHVGLPAAPTLAASTTTTTTAATTATTAVGLGPSFVDVQRTSIELLTIQPIDCGAGRAVRHGHEREAARPSGVPVGDHDNFFDIAKRGERVAKRIFAGVETHVSYVDLQSTISNL